MSIFADAITKLEHILGILKDDVITEIAPSVAYLQANVPAVAIKLGEALLAGELAGSPWAVLLTTLTTQAEAQGVILLEGAAKVALNTAQNNLIAKAAVAPVVVPAENV